MKGKSIGECLIADLDENLQQEVILHAQQSNPADEDGILNRIHRLGHASFRINGPPHTDSPTLYIDPWRIPANSPPADIILVSHDHYDHCSPSDIERISQESTVVIASRRAAELIGAGAQAIRPWQGAINIRGMSICPVPAYTVDKSFHAREFDGLGFLVSFMCHDIYYAGDTDLIPEMAKIGCDIALLPVGGAFTMNYEEAAEAVRRLRPTYVIPMHYGREIPGSKDDGWHFCQLVNGNAQALELPIEMEDR